MVEERIQSVGELLGTDDIVTFPEIAFWLQQCHVSYEKPAKNLGELLKKAQREKVKEPDSTSETLHVLSNVNLMIYREKITALIGPSGAGKSTILKLMNRMLEVVYDKRKEPPKISGKVLMRQGEGYQDLYAPDIDPVLVRRTIGMVFQQPNPLPGTIYDNVVAGPRNILGIKDKATSDELAKTVLEMAYLWDDVKKDWKKKKATRLSGGQQQRLCIARALAMGTKTLLMDEPCSALDPHATKEIEDLMIDLKHAGYTIVIVTHKMEQAQRVSDYTGVVMRRDEQGHLTADPSYGSKIVQFGDTEEVFLNPIDSVVAGFREGKWG